MINVTRSHLKRKEPVHQTQFRHQKTLQENLPSTDENDSAADKNSSTELLKESALLLNSNEPELSETDQKNQNDEMSRNETNENINWLTER